MTGGNNTIHPDEYNEFEFLWLSHAFSVPCPPTRSGGVNTGQPRYSSQGGPNHGSRVAHGATPGTTATVSGQQVALAVGAAAPSHRPLPTGFSHPHLHIGARRQPHGTGLIAWGIPHQPPHTPMSRHVPSFFTADFDPTPICTGVRTCCTLRGSKAHGEILTPSTAAQPHSLPGSRPPHPLGVARVAEHLRRANLYRSLPFVTVAFMCGSSGEWLPVVRRHSPPSRRK